MQTLTNEELLNELTLQRDVYTNARYDKKERKVASKKVMDLYKEAKSRGIPNP